MSGAAADDTDRLNFADLVARIERQQEETRKFVAEQHKLTAEAAKLSAEAARLNCDRNLSPWVAGGAIAGGILTRATLLLRVLEVLSCPPTACANALALLRWSQRV